MEGGGRLGWRGIWVDFGALPEDGETQLLRFSQSVTVSVRRDHGLPGP